MTTATRNLRRCYRAAMALAGLLLTAVANAQSLDEAVRRQLNNDCIVLSNGDTSELGPDLGTICSASFGSNRGTADSGGGGASSQTLAVSVENRRRARLEEESATELVKRWGLFLNGTGEILDRERTAFADGFDSTIAGFSLGADYRIRQQWIAGLAVAYRNNSGDFNGGGEFDTDSTGASLYTSFTPTKNSFVDVAVSYASKSHEVHRFAHYIEVATVGGQFRTYQGIVDSDTDGSEQGAHALFGYDFSFGGLTIGPRVGVDWTHTEVDGYAESGGGSATISGTVRGAAGLALIYEDQEVDSLQSKVGAQASMPLNLSSSVLMIQGNVDYLHEFDNDQRLVNVRFVQDLRANPRTFQFQTDEPVRDYFKLGVSAIWVLPGGIQPFLNLQGMVGNEQFDNYAATLGVRWEL